LLEAARRQFLRLALQPGLLGLEAAIAAATSACALAAFGSSRSASSIEARYSAILRSIAAFIVAIFAGVITRLRLATAAILVPSIANNSAPNSDCSRKSR